MGHNSPIETELESTHCNYMCTGFKRSCTTDLLSKNIKPYLTRLLLNREYKYIFESNVIYSFLVTLGEEDAAYKCTVFIKNSVRIGF